MGKSTLSMVIFNSYFDITRGYSEWWLFSKKGKSQRGSIGSSIFPTWSNWADIRKGATSSTETFIWRSSKALTWEASPGIRGLWRLLQEPWVMTDVPMGHITQPWMVYGLLDGYFFRWCPLYSQNGTVTNPWMVPISMVKFRKKWIQTVVFVTVRSQFWRKSRCNHVNSPWL